MYRISNMIEKIIHNLHDYFDACGFDSKHYGYVNIYDKYKSRSYNYEFAITFFFSNIKKNDLYKLDYEYIYIFMNIEINVGEGASKKTSDLFPILIEKEKILKDYELLVDELSYSIYFLVINYLIRYLKNNSYEYIADDLLKKTNIDLVDINNIIDKLSKHTKKQNNLDKLDKYANDLFSNLIDKYMVSINKIINDLVKIYIYNYKNLSKISSSDIKNKLKKVIKGEKLSNENGKMLVVFKSEEDYINKLQKVCGVDKSLISKVIQ